MKGFKYFSTVLLFMGILTISCSDDALVLKPLGEYSETDVWKDPALSE